MNALLVRGGVVREVRVPPTKPFAPDVIKEHRPRWSHGMSRLQVNTVRFLLASILVLIVVGLIDIVVR